jgi:DNA-binding MarR family transcriptional regulator
VAKKVWLDDREQQAWRDFLAMHAHVTDRLRRSLQHATGLSDADYGVLVSLSEAPKGRMRVFELGRALRWEKSRLSHQLKRMTDRGLITREECPTDARGAFAVLTPAGRAAIKAAAPKHVAQVRQAFVDALTPAQLDALAAISRSVLTHLEKNEPSGLEKNEPSGE